MLCARKADAGVESENVNVVMRLPPLPCTHNSANNIKEYEKRTSFLVVKKEERR